MSDPGKGFSRPKVRFSKSAESPELSDAERAFRKPKIRSVASVKPPIKILKAPLTNDEFERSSSPDGIWSSRSAGDSPSNEGLQASVSVSASRLSQRTSKIHPSDVRLSTDEGKTRKILPVSDQPNGPLKSILMEKRASSKNIHPGLVKECKKSSISLPSKISDRSESVVGEDYVRVKTAGSDKENIPARTISENVPKVPVNTPRTSDSTVQRTFVRNRPTIGEKSSKGVVAKRPDESRVRTRLQTQKTVKVGTKAEAIDKEGKSVPSKNRERKKDVASKRPVVGLMACMKSSVERSKMVPIRKTVFRNPVTNPSQVYVGPGLSRSRSPDSLPHSRNRSSRSRSEILSGDKLARPEYNSIACTIKQLSDARSEKVVEDLEHLPDIYRRLVIGKVSSALDFGANEAIYRNLVDLSIDEKQLPARLTRSKDPEPRQRDITPKLSDFFVPTNDEEYRRAVLTRPPSPRVFDTWNPYGISDRIFSWKDSLDRDL